MSDEKKNRNAIRALRERLNAGRAKTAGRPIKKGKR